MYIYIYMISIKTSVYRLQESNTTSVSSKRKTGHAGWRPSWPHFEMHARRWKGIIMPSSGCSILFETSWTCSIYYTYIWYIYIYLSSTTTPIYLNHTFSKGNINKKSPPAIRRRVVGCRPLVQRHGRTRTPGPGTEPNRNHGDRWFWIPYSAANGLAHVYI